ncbi:MAG TPA: DUF222 domain-containing protein, partial [Phycicoccus sp.]|nr:DUF222 domain-containing protein [Phycicoccus sp.]
SLSAEEAFELAGELQALVNAAEGAQGAAAAWGARVETTLTSAGPVDRVHEVGFVDAMAAAELSLAAGVTEGLAGRKVALGAALAARFPRTRDLVLAGALPAASAHKVVDACAGLDPGACAEVDSRLAPRLAAMDPARVAGAARQAAAAVAADQVAAEQARTRRGRTVEVRAGQDGLAQWWGLLPTETSAAMWAAVEALAEEHQGGDPDLTLSEARADALADLVLSDVTVAAKVTLGVPVLTGAASPATDPDAAGGQWVRVERDDDETVVDAVTGQQTRLADLTPASREELSWVHVPPVDHPAGGAPVDLPADPRFTGQAPVRPGLAVSGCDLPGHGVIPAPVLAGMLRSLPLDLTRALLDAETGTLASTTAAAYRPPKALREFVTTRDGTCRMWGCTRRADHLDLDHTRPWPDGPTAPVNLAGLCRRHHRMKQHGKWRYRLDPDGTITWTSTTGRTRVTEPAHRLHPPPNATPEPERPPELERAPEHNPTPPF